MLDLDTGFEELVYEGATIACALEGCTGKIDTGDICFLDHRQMNPTGRNTYCDSCGAVARYERRNAMKRGEKLPIPGFHD